MDRFGIYMEDQRCKVTNVTKDMNFGTIVPCSVGFKQKDGSWVNLWVDVMVTNKTSVSIPLQKGDAFKCWGRMAHSEWIKDDGTKIPQWTCWADRIEPIEQQQTQQFANGDANNMDPLPF